MKLLAPRRICHTCLRSAERVQKTCLSGRVALTRTLQVKLSEWAETVAHASFAPAFRDNTDHVMSDLQAVERWGAQPLQVPLAAGTVCAVPDCCFAWCSNMRGSPAHLVLTTPRGSQLSPVTAASVIDTSRTREFRCKGVGKAVATASPADIRKFVYATLETRRHPLLTAYFHPLETEDLSHECRMRC